MNDRGSFLGNDPQEPSAAIEKDPWDDVDVGMDDMFDYQSPIGSQNNQNNQNNMDMDRKNRNNPEEYSEDEDWHDDRFQQSREPSANSKLSKVTKTISKMKTGFSALKTLIKSKTASVTATASKKWEPQPYRENTQVPYGNDVQYGQVDFKNDNMQYSNDQYEKAKGRGDDNDSGYNDSNYENKNRNKNNFNDQDRDIFSNLKGEKNDEKNFGNAENRGNIGGTVDQGNGINVQFQWDPKKEKDKGSQDNFDLSEGNRNGNENGKGDSKGQRQDLGNEKQRGNKSNGVNINGNGVRNSNGKIGENGKNPMNSKYGSDIYEK